MGQQQLAIDETQRPRAIPPAEEQRMATFFSNRLNWRAHGYFALPVSSDDPELRANPDRLLWLRLQDIVNEAKSGEFSNLPAVLDLYDEASTAVFGYVASRVLGDAGTGACFGRMTDELANTAEVSPGKIFHYCDAFSTHGALSHVPLILREYLALRRRRIDAGSLLIDLSWLLEEDWGPIADKPAAEELPDYERLVMARYECLRETHGAVDALLFNGEGWSVRSLARLFLDQLGKEEVPHIPMFHLRRKFEASTGIDCTSFFRDKKFQPLVAAANLEAFLESGELAKFEPGVRYFFGHRIPH
jgi:hypothetical protein